MRRKVSGLSEARAQVLKPRLEALLAAAPYAARVRADPVELPHRYSDPRDVEVSALLSTCLAYGRADLFKPIVAGLLDRMGSRPARYVAELDVPGAATLLDGFVYRFNLPTDVGVLLLGMGALLREHGSLEEVFFGHFRNGGDLRRALDGFVTAVRTAAPLAALRRALGRERGLAHLLPSPAGPGASKRLNLFLRWMVRGPDGVDFGIWRRIPPSALVIPLDTHIGRMARHLGLTARKDLSWRTAEEITASLRRLDPDDPVRFDFALCHFGMSGACPLEPAAAHCAGCALARSCTTGTRLVRRAGLAPTSLRQGGWQLPPRRTRAAPRIGH